jgi:hypothetical protein
VISIESTAGTARLARGRVPSQAAGPIAIASEPRPDA